MTKYFKYDEKKIHFFSISDRLTRLLLFIFTVFPVDLSSIHSHYISTVVVTKTMHYRLTYSGWPQRAASERHVHRARQQCWACEVGMGPPAVLTDFVSR